MLWRLVISLLVVTRSSFVDTEGDTETMVEALDTHVIVTSGQKAMLACRFHHPDRQVAHSSVQFIWIRQSHAAFDADAILAHNQDLLIADPRLLVQRTESEYSLTIADVDSNDEGVYACEINTQPLQRALIHLYVQEIPTIIDNATSSPIVANEHDNVTMECQARGRPAPYVTWFRRQAHRNETQSDDELLANGTDGQYHLVNVTRQHTGHYECRAANGVNGHVVSKHIELRVVFKPAIRAASMVVYSALGKAVHLRCSAIVPFDTKFFWHRTDNQSLSNHTKKFRSHHGYDGASAQTSLHVKDIERADFGNYTCFAESMAGQSQASIELREVRRTTATSTKTPDAVNSSSATTRIQILKRNQISEQMTVSSSSSSALCSSLVYLFSVFIQQMSHNRT